MPVNRSRALRGSTNVWMAERNANRTAATPRRKARLRSKVIQLTSRLRNVRGPVMDGGASIVAVFRSNVQAGVIFSPFAFQGTLCHNDGSP